MKNHRLGHSQNILGQNILTVLRMNNRGQAVLEYVLLTFVVLLILLAIIVSIARSTQSVANNYFGAYFQCLLEMGELPALGADGDAETECDDLHEPFTVDAGRPLKSDGDSGNGTDYGDNNGDDNSEDSESDNSDNTGTTSDGELASSGASDGAGSSPRGGGGFGGSDMGVAGKTVPLSKADKNKSKNEEEGLDGAPSGTNNFQQSDSFGENNSGRSEYVPIYGSMNLDEEEKKGNDGVKADTPQEQEESLRGKRVPVSVVKSDDTKVKDDEGITFPDFIKILIIAAIILVILIFFGGQVMQYNKSQSE